MSESHASVPLRAAVGPAIVTASRHDILSARFAKLAKITFIVPTVHWWKRKQNFPQILYKELQMGSVAKSCFLILYMRKCANISPYIRRPFVIYDFAPDPFWITFYTRKIFFSFLPGWDGWQCGGRARKEQGRVAIPEPLSVPYSYKITRKLLHRIIYAAYRSHYSHHSSGSHICQLESWKSQL